MRHRGLYNNVQDGVELSQVILLASGGMDSTTVAYLLNANGIIAQPIFFDYGQHCVEKEWSTLECVLSDLPFPPPIRIDVSGIFLGSKSRLICEPDLWSEKVNDDELYIPYRTMFFFTAAAAYAQTHGYDEVYSGFINSNHAKELDCTSEYLNGLDALSENVGPVRFRIPFRENSKREVVEKAMELGVPIGQTFSCQVYSSTPCGACPNCVERLTALEMAGLTK